MNFDKESGLDIYKLPYFANAVIVQPKDLNVTFKEVGSATILINVNDTNITKIENIHNLDILREIVHQCERIEWRIYNLTLDDTTGLYDQFKQIKRMAKRGIRRSQKENNNEENNVSDAIGVNGSLERRDKDSI